MRLAVLFWCYTDLGLCAARLRELRRYNPRLPVYAVYGGVPGRAGCFRQGLGSWLDDFWEFPEDRSPAWKWRHGDRMLARWFAERGESLAWDTVFVMQWDMAVLAPLRDLLGGLGSGEILLSGLRPLAEVEAWWPWAGASDPDRASELEAFRALLPDFGYHGPLWACLFIVACLPRAFLARYADTGPPEVGFLEYKLPTLARAFGIPASQAVPFRPWWATEPATRDAAARDRVLNAIGEPVSLRTVLGELARPDGQRVFHPLRRALPGWALHPIGRRLLRRVGGWL